MQRDLDLIEETRDMSVMTIARYQQLAAEYHDNRVKKKRQFQERDWVLKGIVGNQKKFDHNWEGSIR